MDPDSSGNSIPRARRQGRGFMSRLLRTALSREWHLIPRFPERPGGWACLVMLLLATAPVSAQVTAAEVLGTVLDPLGAGVPNIKVTAQSLTTSTEYSTISDPSGDYLIRSMPPGRYSI